MYCQFETTIMTIMTAQKILPILAVAYIGSSSTGQRSAKPTLLKYNSRGPCKKYPVSKGNATNKEAEPHQVHPNRSGNRLSLLLPLQIVRATITNSPAPTRAVEAACVSASHFPNQAIG